MVFKKPYAFFVKYFRLINFILTILLCILMYKQNMLSGIINDIYINDISNFSSLTSTYIGISTYFLIFFIILILTIILILLKKKDKPLKDYFLALLYNIILIIFFVVIGNLLDSLESIVVEISTIKIYSDISLLIMIPNVYFIFKFIMISIGFNLKKFNFSKDIIELKKEESDNEEVELIFTKNTYKYKRGFRKYLREFRYYVLENKVIISIFLGILLIIGGSTLVSVNIFNSNKVGLKENFVAGSLSYKVLNVYESKYDLNRNVIKDGFKFVIASINVGNSFNIDYRVDFNKIRLIYDDEYVYANNYFNEYFVDFGVPYNNQYIKSGENKNYVFIFKVPESYKSRKYILKFYDKNVFEDEELKTNYKSLKVKATSLDKNQETKKFNVKQKLIFDKKIYGESSINIKSFVKDSSYTYYNDNIARLIIPKNVNEVLLILEYDLVLDSNNSISSYFNNDKEFFSKFLKVSYKDGDTIKKINNTNVIEAGIDNRVFISIPYKLLNISDIQVSINFRDYEYICEL